MTDKQFPDDYPEFVAPGPLAAFLASDAGVPGWVSRDTLADAIGPTVNLLKYCVGDGVTVDTTGFAAACAAAAALSIAPHIYVPAGREYVIDALVTVTTSYIRFFGQGTLTFKGAGQLQLGDGSTVASHCEFQDIIVKVDASSSVQAPISAYNAGRTIFKQVSWIDIKASAIDARSCILVLRHCDTRMMAAGGASVIHAAPPTGKTVAIFIQGGRFNSADHATKVLVDHTGAGEVDGLVLMGVSTAGLDGVIKSAPASGGHLSNCVVQGGLFDQVDQRAFWFAPAAGAALNDVFIGGGAKINGWGSSTSTADVGLITLDLSSGAAHGDYAFTVDDVTLVNARRRAIEVLGGTYKQVVLSHLRISEYGRSANAASRGIYVAAGAAFASLEVSDCALSTTFAHDYGIEIATGATATKSKVEGNTHTGTAAATLADINTTAFASRRTILQADRTYYVRTDGSDSNAGLANSATGAFLTRQAAWDAVARLDLNGFNVTIQIADGTYTGGLTATKVPIGQGTITIQGNLTTWSNCLISTTSTDCFRFPTCMAAIVLIQGFKLTTTTSGRCIIVTAPVQVQINKIEFGACATQHMNATNAGAMISAATSAAYSLSSNVSTHISAQRSGQVSLTGATITFTGSLTLTNFASASDAGLVVVTSMTWVGTFTGGKASSSSNSVIDNAGAANIPGTTGPSTTTGGQYI